MQRNILTANEQDMSVAAKKTENRPVRPGRNMPQENGWEEHGLSGSDARSPTPGSTVGSMRLGAYSARDSMPCVSLFVMSSESHEFPRMGALWSALAWRPGQSGKIKIYRIYCREWVLGD